MTTPIDTYKINTEAIEDMVMQITYFNREIVFMERRMSENHRRAMKSALKFGHAESEAEEYSQCIADTRRIIERFEVMHENRTDPVIQIMCSTAVRAARFRLERWYPKRYSPSNRAVQAEIKLFQKHS